MRPRPPVHAATSALAAIALAGGALGGCSAAAPGGPPAPGATMTPPEAAISPPAAGTPARPGRPLVVETVLGPVDLDPARLSGTTDAMLARALYQTLTTLSAADPTRAVPGLAEYTISPEGRWLTLRLRAGATFADGTPVTTDDVLFSLRRAQGLGGPPARVLGPVRMTKVDERTLTISSPDANFALPVILANPAFGILDSSVVKARGGTIGPQDTAGRWLQTHSAGSGPYVLGSRTATSVTLEPNPRWSGPPPAHPVVRVKTAGAIQQLADLTAGRADIVLDLSPRQAQRLRQDAGDTALRVVPVRSSTTAYLAFDVRPGAGRWTAEPGFAAAVRDGLDRAALTRRLHEGAIPAPGLLAPGVVGALKQATNPTPAPGAPAAGQRDLRAARVALERAGYRGQPVRLVYARDRPIAGLPAQALAELVAGQLAQAGIRVETQGLPAAKVEPALATGAAALVLRGFTPAYLDPGAYLSFAPGRPLGLQAGWAVGADPLVDRLTVAAMDSVGAQRTAAYQAWQRAMGSSGPFVPLVQPIRHLAHDGRVGTLATNPLWTVDLAATR